MTKASTIKRRYFLNLNIAMATLGGGEDASEVSSAWRLVALSSKGLVANASCWI